MRKSLETSEVEVVVEGGEVGPGVAGVVGDECVGSVAAGEVEEGELLGVDVFLGFHHC